MIMGAVRESVQNAFQSFVDTENFKSSYGEAEVRMGDHFGHGAFIVCFGDYELTVANVPGEKDHHCLPGVYLKIASSQSDNPAFKESPSLIINKGGSPILLEYKMISEDSLSNLKSDIELAFLDAVKDAKVKADNSKVVTGLSPVSFSRAQRKLLNKVGIRTVNDIEQRGYARVYLDIKAISGQMLNEEFLASLWGVVNMTHPARVTQSVLDGLVKSVRDLSMSDLRNHINMSTVVIERLRQIGLETMDEIRNSDIKQIARKLIIEFGPDVGYETALAVYAATLREGGVSVQNIGRVEMADFDGVMYDVTSELRIKGSFQGGVNDGFSALLSLVRGNRFKQDF